MIVEEYNDTNTLVTHYSDSMVKIIQSETGALYDSATDVVPCVYTYTESSEGIESAEISDTDALSIIVGRSMATDDGE